MPLPLLQLIRVLLLSLSTQTMSGISLLFHSLAISSISCIFWRIYDIIQPNKASANFFEVINKIITVGVTDDLFSVTEKAQFIDDYGKWINENDMKKVTRYVTYTCVSFVVFVFVVVVVDILLLPLFR